MIIAEKFIRAIEIDILKFFYLPVPKNGTSSLKNLIFFLNYDQMYKESEIYKILGIHAIYPTQHTLERKYVKPYNFLKTHFKLKFLNYNSLFITRDPIERFLSGFNDRVLFQNKLKISYSNNFDKLNFFIDNFEKFLFENRDINWHFSSQYSFLNIYKKKYDKIIFIKLNNIEEFLVKYTKGLLKERVVKFYDKDQYNFNSTKSKKSISAITVNDLNSRQIEFINSFYQKDFNLNL
tara:strand:- start:767 stop:1474 length:708 start_codon:yes stop_codon:yes gene_type:complete